MENLAWLNPFVGLFLQLCRISLCFIFLGLSPLNAATPDFSNVNDVLDGRRTLFPVDDLVVTSRFFNDISTGSSVDNSLLTSKDSQLNLQPEINITNDGTNFATGIGRMFDLPRDVILTMTPNSVNIHNKDPNGAVSVNFAVSGYPRGLVMDDFTGDGFADAAIVAADGFDDTSGVIRIVTANNVMDINAGVFSNNGVGPKFVNFNKPISITSGDFNGDGKRQIALANLFKGGQLLLYIYDIEVSRDNQGAITAINFVESAFLNYSATSVDLIGAELKAGDFDGVLNQKTARSDDELVLALHFGDQIDLRTLKVVEQSTDPDKFTIVPVISKTLVKDVATKTGTLIQLESNRFAWFASLQQIAVLYFKDNQPFLAFATTDSALNIDIVNKWNLGNDFAPTTKVLGMAFGNFDQAKAFTDSFSLQVAVVVQDLSVPLDMRFSGLVYQILAEHQFELEELTEFSFLTNPPAINTFKLNLTAGDVQGRSLQLGLPQKVTLTDHSQPSIIMGAPPMHIDYIQSPNPDGPGFTFEKVNMTAFPSTDKSADLGMNTQFTFGSSSTGSNVHTETTSVSYSTSESTSVGLSFGVPDVASIGGSLSTSAVQTHDSLVANKYGSYAGNSFEIDVISGFGDILWFNSKTLNVWLYPVIGHEACPLASPNCPSECASGVSACPKLPLHIAFSGPTITTMNEGVAANDVEWYQSTNEVGNILSYPGDLAQLQEDSVKASRFDLLAGPNTFTTGNTGIMQEVSWVNGSSSGNTAGTVKTHSSSVSASASASGFIADIGIGASASGSFKENNSTSFSNFNTAVETISATTGVGINLPSFDNAELYSYPITGYIFGASADPNRLHTNLDGCLNASGSKPPDCPDGIQPVDFVSHGPLWIRFTANAGMAPSDTWWQTVNAYTLPDAALQHPNRWRKVSQSSGPLSAEYCFNEFVPTEPNNTQAYDMKGLFITPEDTFNGPQLTTANEGDVLRLTTRVHNYSLVDMDDPSLTQPADVVKVQFYAQEWCAVNDGSCSLHEFNGPWFFLGETNLGPIPGVNSTQMGNPVNHALATITWGTGTDTQQSTYGCGQPGSKTDCGGKYLKFWVVTWMEDASGSLVAEYKEHGLSVLPPNNMKAIADFPIEAISNNAGLYQQEFFVCPSDVTCPTPNLTDTLVAPASVQLSDVSVSRKQVKRHQPVHVSATLTTDEQGVGPVHVFYYDGAPDQDGVLLDVERIPYISADSQYVSRIEIRPGTSGLRDIHAVVQHNGDSQISSTPLNVASQDITTTSCTDPLSPGANLSGSLLKQGSTNSRFVTRVRGQFKTAPTLDLSQTEFTIDKLLFEDGGAGELIRASDGSIPLPMTLTALPGNNAYQAVFKSSPDSDPRIMMKLKKRRNQLHMNLVVHSSRSPKPEICRGKPQTTTLETRIHGLTDGQTTHGSLIITEPWLCKKDRNGEIHSLRMLKHRWLDFLLNRLKQAHGFWNHYHSSK